MTQMFKSSSGPAVAQEDPAAPDVPAPPDPTTNPNTAPLGTAASAPLLFGQQPTNKKPGRTSSAPTFLGGPGGWGSSPGSAGLKTLLGQ